MKLRFAAVLIAGLMVTTAFAQQQGFFGPTAVPQPAAGQTTTPANQGVTTNPTGDATTGGQQGLITTTDPNVGAIGGVATNSTGGSAFGLGATNQLGLGATNGTVTGTAPLFLNVTATTITDANGSPIGVLQQLALSPSGQINFGIVNAGGRLIPVPWQLIVNSTSGTRGALALNAAPGILQRAPPVAMGQLPMLTQDEVQAQILSSFGLQPSATAAHPTVVTTGTARGGTGGAGVTLTGGSTNIPSFGLTSSTNSTAATTNAVRRTNGVPNNMMTNQAVNTTGGLLSPTGRTNGIFDPYNSGPGSFDRMGPRQNANPTQPRPVITPPANTGQPQPQQ